MWQQSLGDGTSVYNVVSVQFYCLSHVWLSVTPWTAACQFSLSITNSPSWWFGKYFKPTVEIYSSKKRSLSKYDCSLTMHLVTQEFWRRCTKRIMLFSCRLTQYSFCSPMDEGVILTSKSYLRNIFCKAIDAIHSDSPDEYGHQLLNFLESIYHSRCH